jgi:hypothetical protein
MLGNGTAGKLLAQQAGKGMKTRPWANCSGMGGSTISFAGVSFGTATSGVAPLTSFAVCAAAEIAQNAIAMPMAAPRLMMLRFVLVIIDLLVTRCPRFG